MTNSGSIPGQMLGSASCSADDIPVVRRDPRYSVWKNIRRRCYDPTNRCYPLYGGRGIGLCPEWHDFRTFAAGVGQRPDGLTLDRIDGSRGYEPGNVRWASLKTQNRNRRGVTATPEVVRAIRATHAELGAGRLRAPMGSLQKLAADYGITIHAVKDICTHRTWSEL